MQSIKNLRERQLWEVASERLDQIAVLARARAILQFSHDSFGKL
jgi:hypothetical protein